MGVRYLILTMVLALTACSSGEDTLGQRAALFKDLSAVVGPQEDPAPLPTLTRPLLDSLTLPSLEAVIEDQDATAYLIPYHDRPPVTVWTSPDGVQLVLRSGLITGTRGLGENLISSDYASTLAMLRGQRRDANRRLFFNTEGPGQAVLTVTCRLSEAGREDFVIVGRTYPVIRMVETCAGDGLSYENTYRIGLNDGLIRQSRQWLGPRVGFIRTRLLNP